jgi:2-dehydro-3-deoxyphosphogluconate aldolase/(4S)-4-hydroxy-2-oxoglutarate aldolase
MGEAAIQAGAQFLVSPGTSEALLQFAVECRVPFLPGVSTVSEIMRLLEIGCTTAKLFPAEALGGVSFLRCVAGPLPSMKFCPTGGLDAGLAPRYLRLPNVLAVAGSWMAPDELIRENQLDDIRRLAEHAAVPEEPHRIWPPTPPRPSRLGQSVSETKRGEHRWMN